MSKVSSLPPTNSIQDPNTRAFLDAMVNAWQLRNGHIGHDDSQRFITKEEWDTLANSPGIQAIAKIGKPGINGLPGKPGTTLPPLGPGNLPPGVQNLINLLTEPITLVNINHFTQLSADLYAQMVQMSERINQVISDTSNEVNARIAAMNALSTGVYQTIGRTEVGDPVHSMVSILNRIWATLGGTYGALGTDFESVDVTALEATATRLQAIDVVSGTGAGSVSFEALTRVTKDAAIASALNRAWATLNGNDSIIIDSNLATVTPDVATTNKWSALYSRLFNAEAGISNELTTRSTRDLAIAQAINLIWANLKGDSSSIFLDSELATAGVANAEATRLNAMVALTGFKSRIFVQSSAPGNPYGSGPTAYQLQTGDIWINTGDGNKLYTWQGAWAEAPDTRIAQALAGVASEQNARTISDTALASALNTVWAVVGNNNSLVQNGSTVAVNESVGAASNWTAVQTEVLNPDGSSKVAAIRTDFNTYANANTGYVNASYTLRINVNNGGTNTIGGFGLMVDGQTNSSAFVVAADSFTIANANGTVARTPFVALTVPTVINGLTYPPGVWMDTATIQLGTITRAHIVSEIESINYVHNHAGWAINSDTGDAEFNNVLIRGTSVVHRLTIEEPLSVDVFCDNNGAVVGHASQRAVVASPCSANGNAAMIGIDANSLTVRLDFSSGGTVRIFYL